MKEALHDCTGCTDRHSEGTHQGHTKQHPCPEGGDPNCGYCAPHQNEAEWAFKTGRECESFVDHQPAWCGDCYACSNCGLKFVILKGYVSHTQIAEVVAELETYKLILPNPSKVQWSHDYNSAIDRCIEALKAKLINPK